MFRCSSILLLIIITSDFPVQILSFALCRQSYYDNFPEKVKVGKKKFFIQRRFIANFSESAQNCREEGAELASFDSDFEYKHVTNYIKTLKVLPKKYYRIYNFADQRFWLSATRNKEIGRFVWGPTGKIVKPYKWAFGEPNNSLQDENCLEMWSNFEFNDYFCSELNYFICQCYTAYMLHNRPH